MILPVHLDHSLPSPPPLTSNPVDLKTLHLWRRLYRPTPGVLCRRECCVGPAGVLRCAVSRLWVPPPPPSHRHAAPLDNWQMILAICAGRIRRAAKCATGAAAGGPVRMPPPVTAGLRAAPTLFSPRPIRRPTVKAAAHVTSHPLCNAGRKRQQTVHRNCARLPRPYPIPTTPTEPSAGARAGAAATRTGGGMFRPFRRH